MPVMAMAITTSTVPGNFVVIYFACPTAQNAKLDCC